MKEKTPFSEMDKQLFDYSYPGLYERHERTIQQLFGRALAEGMGTKQVLDHFIASVVGYRNAAVKNERIHGAGDLAVIMEGERIPPDRRQHNPDDIFDAFKEFMPSPVPFKPPKKKVAPYQSQMITDPVREHGFEDPGPLKIGEKTRKFMEAIGLECESSTYSVTGASSKDGSTSTSRVLTRQLRSLISKVRGRGKTTR